jgi:hypothetical protein
MLAKLLAFIYYSPGEFEDFFVGLAADPSEVNCDGSIMLSKEYFTISKAESGDVALEVIRYHTRLGCNGDSIPAYTTRRYVYLYCKNVQITA